MTHIGMIYKIESDCGSVLYIGSTTKSLNDRFKKHKSQLCVISKYLKDSNYKFSKGCELLKEYKVIDKRHLLAYEQLWINKHKQCINKLDTFSLLKKQKKKQYREKNKDKLLNKKKEYYEMNKDKLLNRMKEYRKNNKLKLFDKSKKYYEANKDKLKEYQKGYREMNKQKISNRMKEYREMNKDKKKEYYEKNKEKLSAKTQCECGSNVSKRHIKDHYKTNKHNQYIYDVCKEVLEDIISLI